MRTISALIALFVLAAPALAQSDSVTVGGDASGQTLIDPATGQSRYVPALLQPWQDDSIRLRPPGHHRARKPATAATPPADTTSSFTDVTPPPKKHVRTAAVTPPAEAVVQPAAAKPAPPKPAAAKPAAKPAPVSGFADIDLITGTGQQPQTATAPTRTASIEKPKPKTASGTRKESVTFAPGASDPSTAALASVRALAATLSTSLGESARVSLMAYAGPKGEKSSDTRRLSLKRARVVRQILIDGGVPAEKIDVYALGGTDDDGELDRVDVLLKS